MNPLPADLAAGFDWAARSLGPPQDWPVEMRTMVAAGLATGRPASAVSDTAAGSP